MALNTLDLFSIITELLPCDTSRRDMIKAYLKDANCPDASDKNVDTIINRMYSDQGRGRGNPEAIALSYLPYYDLPAIGRIIGCTMTDKYYAYRPSTSLIKLALNKLSAKSLQKVIIQVAIANNDADFLSLFDSSFRAKLYKLIGQVLADDDKQGWLELAINYLGL